MTHLLACWIEHSSLAPNMQLAMLGITYCAFRHLDWGALSVKQMFAAEIMRLEAESDDEHVQKSVSVVSRKLPEIRAIQWAIKRIKKIPIKSASLHKPLPWQYVSFFLLDPVGRSFEAAWPDQLAHHKSKSMSDFVQFVWQKRHWNCRGSWKHVEIIWDLELPVFGKVLQTYIWFSFGGWHFHIRIRYDMITAFRVGSPKKKSDSTDRLSPFSWQCPWGVVSSTGSLTSCKQCFLIEVFYDDLFITFNFKHVLFCSCVFDRFCLFEAFQPSCTAVVSLAPSATTCWCVG